VESYRTPDERFDGLSGYAFVPRYLEQDGLRMHYAEEGTGNPVLLLHGEPTWAYLYRKMTPPLARVGRVVAPDYFGFGRSDKPMRIEDSPGGPSGAARDSEHRDRCRSRALTRMAPVPRVRAARGDRAHCRAARSHHVRERAPRGRAGGVQRPLPDAGVEGRRAGVPELVPTELEHPSAAKMLEVRAALERWEKPALVLFSDSDPIFTPEAAERLAARIPGAGSAEIVAGAGHFLQEEKGEEIAERIVLFLDEAL
jgi:haloalkane dehalogenase